jgi:nitroreductase
LNILEALQARHSTRAYKPLAVDRETILKILEAANYAPSWANTQPWEFYVAAGKPLAHLRQKYLESYEQGVPQNPDIPYPQSWPKEHKKRIFTLGAERFAALGIEREDKEARFEVFKDNLRFFDAPVVIFACMDRELSLWSLFDLGSVSQSLMLAAQHYGLNTIPAILMAGYPEIIRRELQIPDDLKIVIAIALGYGDPESIQNKYLTTRRPLEEFVKLAGI